MAEKRMISKSISISEKVNTLPDIFDMLLFTWLIPHTDDFGRLTGSPAKIKALVVPMLDKTIKDIELSLQHLHNAKLIIWYEISSEKFLQIIKFEKHQTGLNKRTKSKIPEILGNSEKFQEIPLEEKGTEEKGIEQKGRECEILPLINLHKVNFDKDEQIIYVESFLNTMDFEVIEDAIIRSSTKHINWLLKALNNILSEGKTKKESLAPRFISPTEQEAINAQRKADELKNQPPLTYNAEFEEVNHASVGGT